MRLLNVDSLELKDFAGGNLPKYVTASHRWASGSETSFKDVLKQRNKDTTGYQKVQAFAIYVKTHIPSIKWLWIDTCCINQDSAAELSEAVNLMFEWYRNSEICVAYLADVEIGDCFEDSEWFRRGWTLQELLAPRTVVFVTSTWQVIGFKGLQSTITRTGPSVDKDVQRATGIPMQALYDYKTSLGFTVDERLKWMERRITTKEEDMSYALYGIIMANDRLARGLVS